MSCRGFIQLLLKVINFLFALVGLAMIGYGIYMIVEYNNSSSSSSTASTPPPPPPPPPPPSDDISLRYRAGPDPVFKGLDTGSAENGFQLRRALLEQGSVTLSVPRFNTLSSFWSTIPTIWFLCVFIGLGVVISVITCSGYIAAATVNGCCLSCYSFFIAIFILIELGLAGFMYFDENWQELIPSDSTGELDNIETFIEDRIVIFRWVALAAIILQAFALLLSIILRALGGNREVDYDSDGEYVPTRAARQPLLNRQTTGTVPPNTVPENRPRTDAWSTRMREKYGLDTKEFSYNPVQQPTAAPEVKKSWCSIM